MASGGGGTAAAAVATEKLIRSAQKSTNQLKALLAGGGGGRSSGAVEVILSDISDSLSQALASLVLHAASDDRLLPAAAPPEVSLLPSYGQSVVNSGGRSVSKRKAQRRSRADGSSRRIILERGDPDDSYPWRKYGQKDILGARFARSYYRCAQMLGCSARKHVQQSDDDPSRLEITYIGAHTCGGDRPSATAISLVDDKRCNTATSHMPVAAAVPSALQKLEEQYVPASSDDMMMACAHTCGGDRPSSPATNPVDGTRCDAATSHRLLPSALQKLDEHVVTSSDDMMVACTPSMAASSWLFIPSPACSQSELLSEAEVPKLRVRQEQDASPDDPVEVEEHKKPCDADHESLPLHDSVVPDFL